MLRPKFDILRLRRKMNKKSLVFKIIIKFPKTKRMCVFSLKKKKTVDAE